MSDFDAILWRPLQSGNEYEALFPNSACKTTYVGTGNTDLSISEMEKVILQYAWQTKKIANELQKKTLQATVASIHSFLFNNFQYKADDSNQLLRSPACSWKMRKDGIDCKSYSILASSILLNLKITHYVRKIKQPGYAPNDFTHVYVIVPKNQNTGSLSNGYLVIDGTLRSNIEPAFIGEKDLKMEGLKHYSLNAPTGDQASSGGGGNFFQRMDWSKVKSFISGIGCLGINGREKSAYTHAALLRHLTAVDALFAELIQDINLAGVSKNYVLMARNINEYRGLSKVFHQGGVNTLARKSWNSCTAGRLRVSNNQLDFYKSKINPLLSQWLSTYFNVTLTGANINYVGTGHRQDHPGLDLLIEGLGLVPTVSEPAFSISPKTTGNIPAFVLTQYVQNLADSTAPLDYNAWLASAELVGSFLQTSQFPQGGTFEGGNNEQTFDPNATKTAGMGWLVGGAVAIVGLGIVFGQMKDKPIKK